MKKTIMCIIIVGLVLFLVLTIAKIEEMPQGNSCIDLSCPTCYGKYNCDDYNYWEKIRYVWNLY